MLLGEVTRSGCLEKRTLLSKRQNMYACRPKLGISMLEPDIYENRTMTTKSILGIANAPLFIIPLTSNGKIVATKILSSYLETTFKEYLFPDVSFLLPLTYTLDL